jgi:hypothetical protein
MCFRSVGGYCPSNVFTLLLSRFPQDSIRFSFESIGLLVIWPSLIPNKLARKAIDRSLLQGETIEQFRAAIRNPITRDQYERRLIGFLKTVKMTPDEFVAKAKSRRHAIEKIVISFISAENNRVENREVTAGTVGNIIKAVKTLLEMNDVTSVNWKKIKRVLPKVRIL